MQIRSWLASAGVVAALLAVPGGAKAGGFVDEKGSIWAKIGYRSWDADQTFAGPADYDSRAGVELGDPIPFDRNEGGRLALRALELQVEYVPLDRLVVGTYFPAVQYVRFENRNFISESIGTGDIRPYAGYQFTPAGADAAATLYLRGKIPTTRIDTSFLSVPLSEGQFDLAVEQVGSWEPVSRFQITAGTMFRYRFPGRFPNSGEQYKPGNEFVVRLVAGGSPVRSVWIKGGLRGLWSTGWENREAPGPERTTFRAYQQLFGGLYWSWGELVGGAARGFAVESSVSWPIGGRDYPRGLTWSAAIAWSRKLDQ